MFLCLCHALVYIPSFLACRVYFMLCSILWFCLSFEFHFLIHLASFMHHLLPLFIYSFLSLLTLDSFVYSWQKGGECIGEYTGVFHHFYMTRAHSQREKFYLVHIRRGRKPLGKCIYQGGEDIFLWENIVLFVLLYAYFLVALWCFKLHSISMLCCFHCIVFLC